MTENIAAGERARATPGGIAAVSAALLMTELALTRIFSVTMYYHFAFLAMSIAFSRMTGRINVLYAADLIGAATGCLVLIPLLNWLGAPGVVMTAAALSTAAAVAFAPPARRPRFATL